MDLCDLPRVLPHFKCFLKRGLILPASLPMEREPQKGQRQALVILEHHQRVLLAQVPYMEPATFGTSYEAQERILVGRNRSRSVNKHPLLPAQEGKRQGRVETSGPW